MRRRRNVSWTIALCASLAAHAALIRWRADQYTSDHTHISLAGLDPISRALLEQQQPKPEDQLGDTGGKGYATDASSGEIPLQAQKADEDQSFLSRDPQGFGKVGSPPSPSTMLPGDNGANGSPLTAAALSPPAEAQPIMPTRSEPEPKFVADLPKLSKASPKPIPTTQTLAMSAETPSPPTEQAQAANAAPPGHPGNPAPPADPAPQAKTESDPTSVAGSLEFHQGSTTVRIGRKHRLTRPHLPWDAQYDFFGMTRSTLVLDLQLDTTGQVISATILKSSGSASVDQACRIAAYEWWFEPAKDSAGHIVADDIQFTIRFL